jgi:molecular chaperone GrpE
MSNEHTEENSTAEETQPTQTSQASQASPEATPAPAPEEAAAPEANGIETLQADVERFRDLALRTQADFENYRKRAARDKEDAIKSATAALIERLLPVLDNFERGLQAARNGGAEGILVGFEMVARQLNDFIASSGVEVIDAEGKPFDHNLHEALGTEASDSVPEGNVIRQVRKGYKFRDRLIRAANVFVSSGPAQS